MKLSKELEEQLALCVADTKFCAKYLFPEYFSAEFSILHQQIFDAIDSGAPRIVIAAPRGIGKTTSVVLGYAAKQILFRLKRFVVYVSNSSSSAELQTENLKRELIANQNVKTLFGPVRATSADGVDETFSKRAWVSNGGTLVYPRGSGQQVRGLLHGNSRPDLIIIDDLEDTDTINNEEIRKARKTWFHGDLLKCVSRLDKNWQIIYIDTLKHEDSLMQELLDSNEWLSLRLELCDDDFNSLAPEFISTEEIKKEATYHRTHNMMDVFFREFRNIAVSKENPTFSQAYFKYYELSELDAKKDLETIILVDPAKSVTPQAAESAIVAVTMDLASSRLYVRDIVHGRLHPDELYHKAFEMAMLLKAKVLGIEVTSLNEFIVQPLKNEMHKRGAFFTLVELKARGSKEGRIAALIPYYRQGYIYHLKGLCDPLEAQLLSFPRSRLWDIMDAFAYIIEITSLGDRYFQPPAENAEDEYAELVNEYDPPVEGWRAA